MAILCVSEYTDLAKDQNTNLVLCGTEPSRAYQQVSIGAGSLQSTAFGNTTRFVRLHCDVAARIIFGDNPTAAAGTSMRMAAGQTEYFGVRPGQKVAVING